MIVVALTGDVDLSTAETMWEELSAQLAPASAVALECTGITFMDSMGLQALMRAHQLATERQASFMLVGANKYVDRVLELAGLTGLIPYFADIEAARIGLGMTTD